MSGAISKRDSPRPTWVVEREFRTKTVHQGYIEPQNGTASWSPEGRLTIWCSSQGHFGIRDAVAELLDIPVSQLKVVPDGDRGADSAGS